MSNKKKTLRVFEGFAGYGGASFGLMKVKEKHKKFNYNVVAYSEIDKHASELFDLNHKNNKGKLIKNYPDILNLMVLILIMQMCWILF